MRAGSEPSSIRSRRFCSVRPLPESRTPRRTGFFMTLSIMSPGIALPMIYSIPSPCKGNASSIMHQASGIRQPDPPLPPGGGSPSLDLERVGRDHPEVVLGVVAEDLE